jgi:mono/diheme cytochrome c family protein
MMFLFSDVRFSEIRRGLARSAALLGVSWLAIAPSQAEGTTPTYHREVVRILQKNCQECHRPGQVGPFSLLNYEQARKRAADIVGVTEARTMPPWPASTKEGGPFRDARVLSEQEISTLEAWVSAGSPEGNPGDAPPPRSWASEWTLGPPDLVLTPSESFTLEADGRDEFRVYVIPSGLTEGRWIAAVDIRPGNARVVHHVLSAFDTAGRARKLDEAEPGAGYQVFGGYGIIPSGNLGGWAPGKQAHALADGLGRYLPAGSDVLMQVHYHKNGKVETDRTSIGLYYAKAPVDKQVRGTMVVPPRKNLFGRPDLLIPAGAANHEVTGSQEVRNDVHLTAVTPHMHWIGKDFILKATRPDGSAVTLIKVDQWNFNWQGTYDLVEPVALPKGTKIEMSAHFDNSAKNPNNPSSPPKDVRWGEQTTDEMCIGFVSWTIDDEHLNNQPPAPAPMLPRLRAAR